MAELETGAESGAEVETQKGKGKGKPKAVQSVTFVADKDGNQYTTYGEIGVQFREGKYTTEDDKEIAYLSQRKELSKEGE